MTSEPGAGPLLLQWDGDASALVEEAWMVNMISRLNGGGSWAELAAVPEADESGLMPLAWLLTSAYAQGVLDSARQMDTPAGARESSDE